MRIIIAIILIVAVLLFILFFYAKYRFYKKYRTDVEIALQQDLYFDKEDLTENDIAHLPEPVKKYLRYTGSVGKPKVNNFKIEFEGQIRKDNQSDWMPFTSEQYNTMTTPTRLFFMKAVMNKLPVAGYHHYYNGQAYMDIRLLSLVRVQYMEGEEMNVAETVTFFNDMCCMAPATLIDKRIEWIESTDNRVTAKFTVNHITITAQLIFNHQGQLINFISNDRFSAEAGKRVPWSTPLKDYSEENGYTTARYADAIYHNPNGELCYGNFRVKSVKHNLIKNDR